MTSACVPLMTTAVASSMETVITRSLSKIDPYEISFLYVFNNSHTACGVRAGDDI